MVRPAHCPLQEPQLNWRTSEEYDAEQVVWAQAAHGVWGQGDVFENAIFVGTGG